MVPSTDGNYLYVDNSNVWIEGMHVAAVARGLAPDIWAAQQHRICDATWTLNFGKLYEFAGGDASDVGRAVLYGSRPPANDGLWEAARRKGFDVVVHDRNSQNKEKKIDTSITADIMEDSYERMKAGVDEITLVSGDKDYVPVVEKLVKRGFRFYVVFWDHAARELKDAATKFISLNEHLDHLARVR
ncbi:MAG: NYN domain-containing protein [Kofleriaceae bacterium]